MLAVAPSHLASTTCAPNWERIPAVSPSVINTTMIAAEFITPILKNTPQNSPFKGSLEHLFPKDYEELVRQSKAAYLILMEMLFVRGETSDYLPGGSSYTSSAHQFTAIQFQESSDGAEQGDAPANLDTGEFPEGAAAAEDAPADPATPDARAIPNSTVAQDEISKWIREVEKRLPWYFSNHHLCADSLTTVAQVAAMEGRVDVLNHLLAENLDSILEQSKKANNIAHIAAKFGHLDVLMWIANNSNAGIRRLLNKLGGEYKNSNIAHIAAQYGHLHILQWMYTRYLKMMFHMANKLGLNIAHIAAQFGHLHILQWLAAGPAGDLGFLFHSTDEHGNNIAHIATYNPNTLPVIEWLATTTDDYVQRPLLETDAGEHNCAQIAAMCGNRAVLELLATSTNRDVQDLVPRPQIDYSLMVQFISVISIVLYVLWPITKSFEEGE